MFLTLGDKNTLPLTFGRVPRSAFLRNPSSGATAGMVPMRVSLFKEPDPPKNTKRFPFGFLCHCTRGTSKRTSHSYLMPLQLRDRESASTRARSGRRCLSCAQPGPSCLMGPWFEGNRFGSNCPFGTICTNYKGAICERSAAANAIDMCRS